mgnify:CR=1 FL=1
MVSCSCRSETSRGSPAENLGHESFWVFESFKHLAGRGSPAEFVSPMLDAAQSQAQWLHIVNSHLDRLPPDDLAANPRLSEEAALNLAQEEVSPDQVLLLADDLDSVLESVMNIASSDDRAAIHKWVERNPALIMQAKIRKRSQGYHRGSDTTVTDDDGVMMTQAELVTKKLQEAKETKEELARTIRMRDELSRQVLQLEREAVVGADQIEKMNDDLAGVQAERDLLERKVNELRRELHSKNKEIEHIEAELKQSKSQQIRAMAKLSVQKSKAEKQLTQMKAQLGKLGEDKGALFKEVGSLEAQLAQAHADREEARNWASTYRDMLLKVA